MTKSTL